mmetsp:Transcript_3526/g.9461  ORF Transcript_3526/g.9461 Transcript_3526/m.9461 type:complete len:469 (+) Transcript_3526:2090-3496(+)
MLAVYSVLQLEQLHLLLSKLCHGHLGLILVCSKLLALLAHDLELILHSFHLSLDALLLRFDDRLLVCQLLLPVFHAGLAPLQLRILLLQLLGLCLHVCALLRQSCKALLDLSLQLIKLGALLGSVSCLLGCGCCLFADLLLSLGQLLLQGMQVRALSLQLQLLRLQPHALPFCRLLRCQQLLHLLGMWLPCGRCCLELGRCISELFCQHLLALLQLSLQPGELCGLLDILIDLPGSACKVFAGFLLTRSQFFLLSSQLSALVHYLLLHHLQTNTLCGHCLLCSYKLIHLLGVGLLGGSMRLDLGLHLSHLLCERGLLVPNLGFLLVQVLGTLDILMDLLGCARHLLANLLLARNHLLLLHCQLCPPLLHVLLQCLKAVMLTRNGCLRILQLLALLGLACLDGGRGLQLLFGFSHALRQHCLLLLQLSLLLGQLLALLGCISSLLGHGCCLLSSLLVALGYLLLLGNHL